MFATGPNEINSGRLVEFFLAALLGGEKNNFLNSAILTVATIWTATYGRHQWNPVDSWSLGAPNPYRVGRPICTIHAQSPTPPAPPLPVKTSITRGPQ